MRSDAAAQAREAAAIRTALEPVVAPVGVEIEDVLVRGAGSRLLVQVVVDRDGGVSLDDIAEAARRCSDALDAADIVAGSYILEVTSPGTDRPLTDARHFRRNSGRLVDVTTRDGRKVSGRVVAVTDDELRVSTSKGEQSLAFADVVRGTVQLEFTRAETAT